MTNRTLAIIKPDAIKNGYTGKIYNRILNAEFRILGAKLIRMTLSQAEGFYAVHAGKPFYIELTRFMSSGQSMILALEKENAVAAWRETIGVTNPKEAENGTINKDDIIDCMIKNNGSALREIIIKNYRQKERVDEIITTTTWSLRKMLENSE